MNEFAYKAENLAKAARAVETAAEYFRGLGFCTSDAEHPAKNGHDLEIWRPHPENLELPPVFAATVEVKAVGISNGCWRARGRHLRTGDDYIAFVFPNGRVYVEDFATHEKVRCKDGGRHLQKIARIFV